MFGFGLSGVADGIVLHQVLQWHHLVSDKEPTNTVNGLENNTFADGIFHVVTVVVLVIGVVLLWRAAVSSHPRWSRYAIGGTLVGWGAFHLVDEIVFHVALDLHHIRMVDNYLVYDLAFTVAGLILVVLGAALLRAGDTR